MRDQDWFDDFMDYKLSGESPKKSSASSGGCLSCILGIGAFVWLLFILLF